MPFVRKEFTPVRRRIFQRPASAVGASALEYNGPVMQENVGTVGEKALLRRLRKYVGGEGRVLRAFSEDCAVVDAGAGRLQLMTTDVMVDGLHFRREWMPPFHLGRKAVNVNVSDISAMGGRALFFLVSLGLPPETATAFVDETYRGIESAMKDSTLVLAGGNLSASPVFFIDITMVGEVDRDRVLMRNGAGAGDALFVTGPLGGAACGLALLESGLRIDSTLEEWEREGILAQLDPPVLQNSAAWLSASGLVTSMMDLSDGLAADLPELCRESGVGALLQAARIPVARSAGKLARQDPLRLALTGGEDYHLLFTVSGEGLPEFHRRSGDAGIDFHEVGVIVPAADGIFLQNEAGEKTPLGPGFQHFSGTS